MGATRFPGKFVWTKEQTSARNAFAVFRRRFHLTEAPSSAVLNVFADTRYRLWANGRFVGTGPGRFVTQFPEYDAVELAPYLAAGDNELVVEANFFGASSFQTMPDGKPGFWASGSAGEVDLSTPGEWTGAPSSAWDADAPLFSFAQGPVEICDTRRLEATVGEPVRVLTAEECPWGPFRPFSGTPLPFDPVRPRSVLLAGPLKGDEAVWGFQSGNPEANRTDGVEVKQKPWVGFATWILSDRAQEVELGCFWGELAINGKPFRAQATPDRGNHGTATISLEAGWNLLTGKIEVLTEFWSFLVSLPRKSGLGLSALPEEGCSDAFLLSPVGSKESIVLPDRDGWQVPKGWQRASGDRFSVSPGRLVGWDRPQPGSTRGLPAGRLNEVGFFHAPEATWSLKFAGEFHGHLVLEAEGPAGTVVDVTSDDWVREDGRAAILRSNPFVDATDRFILRGGRQQLELFHPRGGKLVQVTLRSPDGQPADLGLHDLWARSRLIYRGMTTPFSCDDPVFEWAWPTSIRTLTCSADDAYADCPWRERGSYIGDGLVNLHLNMLFTSDLRTARRTFRLFAEAQTENGQLPGVAPAWLRKPHEDYTLLFILAIHDFWANTGDVDLIEEFWPTFERIWASPTWEVGEEGLWDVKGKRCFFDWGILPSEREGRAHGGLNLFRMGAANAMARMADCTGRGTDAAKFRKLAQDVAGAIRRKLWHEAEGRLLPSTDADTPALHTNVLALAMGWGDVDERQRILAYLEPHIRTNLARGLERGQFTGYLELYFLAYLLPALAEMGRADLAEDVVRDHYGYLMSLGDDTLAECFSRAEAGVGSRCHSWSGAAAIYTARYVLGLRPESPGDVDRWVFDPKVHRITRASGQIAHPRGEIRVAWTKSGDSFDAKIEAPEGVVVRTPDQV